MEYTFLPTGLFLASRCAVFATYDELLVEVEIRQRFTRKLSSKSRTKQTRDIFAIYNRISEQSYVYWEMKVLACIHLSRCSYQEMKLKLMLFSLLEVIAGT